VGSQSVKIIIMSIKIKILFLFASLSLINLSNANEEIESNSNVDDKWRLIGPGDADQITSVSVMNNGGVFIGTDIGGLYFSSDQGKSWNNRNTGLLNYDVITPVLQHKKSNMLFVGTRGGLYKSDNAGKNWRNIRVGLPKVKRYKLSGTVGAISIDPFNQKRMLLGLGYRTSADGSNTLKKIEWNDLIYMSDDYGERWYPVKAFEENTKVYQIKYSATKDLVYAATANGLYKSQDGGLIWKKILNKLVYNFSLFPGQKRIVAACGPEGVYSSDDSGSKWKLSNEGLSLGFPHELFSKKVRYSMLVKDPSNDDRLLLLNSTWGMSGGLYVSNDKGNSWDKYTKAMPESWLNTSKHMNAIAFDQNDSDNVYMGSSRYMYRSSDGGNNWEQAISNGTKNKWSHTGLNVFGHTRDFLVDPKNSERFFIATVDHGLVKSDSGGTHWQKAKTGLRKISSVWDLDACIEKKEPNYGKIVILAALKNKTSCFADTVDGGVTWKRYCGLNQYIDRPIKVVIDQADCSTVYIGARNGLFSTENNGLSWRPVPFGQGDTAVNNIVIDKFSTIFVATNKGLFKVTKDGEKTKKALAFSGKEVTSIYIPQLSPDVIFAGVKKSSKKGSALFKSMDSGRTWDRVLESTGFYSGIVQQNKAPYSMFVVTNDHNFHDQSAGSGVYRSEDGGSNWQSINNGLPVLRAWNIATGDANSNDVYLCANGSGVFVLQ